MIYVDEWLHQVATPRVVWSWMSERGCHTTCVRTASTSYSGWPGLWLLCCTSLNCTSSCRPSVIWMPDLSRRLGPWHRSLWCSLVPRVSARWGIARWYSKKEVIYSNLTPLNMVFVSTLIVVAACLIGSAHCRPDDPRDPWHDEEMIQSVREIRTNVRARNPDPPFPRTAVSRRQSPVRHATQDAELIAAGFTHTYRDFFPATRGRKLPSYHAVKVGRQTGIFPSWEEAKRHVEGYPGNNHMAFRKYEDAANWLLDRLAMPDVIGPFERVPMPDVQSVL